MKPQAPALVALCITAAALLPPTQAEARGSPAEQPIIGVQPPPPAPPQKNKSKEELQLESDITLFRQRMHDRISQSVMTPYQLLSAGLKTSSFDWKADNVLPLGYFGVTIKYNEKTCLFETAKITPEAEKFSRLLVGVQNMLATKQKELESQYRGLKKPIAEKMRTLKDELDLYLRLAAKGSELVASPEKGSWAWGVNEGGKVHYTTPEALGILHGLTKLTDDMIADQRIYNACRRAASVTIEQLLQRLEQ